MVAVHKTWLSIYSEKLDDEQRKTNETFARRAIECTRCNSWTKRKKTIIAFAENERNNEWTFWKTLKTNSQVEYFHNTIQWFLFDKTAARKRQGGERGKETEMNEKKRSDKIKNAYQIVSKFCCGDKRKHTKLHNYYDFRPFHLMKMPNMYTQHCVYMQTIKCATMLWLCPLRLWKIKIK